MVFVSVILFQLFCFSYFVSVFVSVIHCHIVSVIAAICCCFNQCNHVVLSLECRHVLLLIQLMQSSVVDSVVAVSCCCCSTAAGRIHISHRVSSVNCCGR